MEFDGLALVYVQVGEPHGGGEQDQQQQELELLPDLLHGEAQHPGSLILRWMTRMGGKEVIPAVRLVAAPSLRSDYFSRSERRHVTRPENGVVGGGGGGGRRLHGASRQSHCHV